MATLYTSQSSNIRKTWLLMVVFLAVIVTVGYFLSYYYNNPGILYFAVIFSVFMNVASYWYSDKIALAVNHARPVKREEDRDLWNIVENLSITAGLPMPKLYIIEDPSPNAFATGRDKNHAVVCVTSGLMQILDKSELEGVIAHELSHVGNRDILLSTVVVVLVGLLSILANIFSRSLLWGGRGSRDNKDSGGLGAILMIVGLIFTILSPFLATLIQLAISRKREFLADSSGALLTRYPEGLANALMKIDKYAQPMKYANSATAHLFISNPFGRAGKKISGLFATHPPVEARVKALMGNKYE